MKRNWNLEEKKYLQDNIGKIDIKNIAANLGRTVRAVNLYIYRNKIETGKPKVKNNILRKLLEVKFGDVRYFTPGKDFFKKISINQKRWQSLLRGECSLTCEEYNSLVTELKIDTEEQVAARQLSLNFESDDKNCR